MRHHARGLRSLGPFLVCAAPFAVLGVLSCTGPEAHDRADAAALRETEDASVRCARDADCDDGVHCNGREQCEPGAKGADGRGCVVGTAVQCDDGIECTLDSCDEAVRGCTVEPPDLDADGHPDANCLDANGDAVGDDCDDTDANRFPGNLELCDDRHDEDCDLTTLGERDQDGDDARDSACCNLEGDQGSCGDDCNDNEPMVAPGHAELCDDTDNDCDGKLDENPTDANWYADADGDGYGDATPEPIIDCAPVDGRVLNDGDCDDDDDQFHPGALEICDGKDNDCDGVDDDSGLCTIGDGGIPDGGLGCQPASRRCDPDAVLTPQLCVAWGVWEDETPCSFLCVDGSCTGSCTPLDRRCNNLTPQHCDAAGQWVNETVCGSHCLAGDCVTCQPTTQRCSGKQLQTCAPDGSWTGAVQQCPFHCNSGSLSCDGVCSPTDRACNGTTQRVCGSDGYWDDTVCSYVCNPGTETCDGVCTPTAKSCSGDTPRTCGANGYWTNGSGCSAGTPYCDAGTCKAPVVNGLSNSFTRWASVSGGYVYARPVTVSAGEAATRLGIHLNTAGSKLVMGLYANAAGAPGALLAATAEATTVIGAQQLNLLSEVNLSPGTYWVGFTFNATTQVHWADDAATEPLHLAARTFNGGMPASIAATSIVAVDTYELSIVARP
jgi:hypothetical protein